MHLKRCDINKFDEIIGEKYIACYGAGNELEVIIKNYLGHKWVDRVQYLIDGNPKIHGKKKLIGERSICVESISALKNLDSSSIVIMPTCSSFYDVIDLLNGMDWLNNVECFVFHCMFNMGEGHIEKIGQIEEQLIPPTIHYCWFGGKPLPDIYKKYIESWRRCCPHYDIIEWNESNCNVNETFFTAEAYEVGKYGFVPDYFRLKIIYEHGGIYLDTDVELIRSLDDLRCNKAFCGTEFPGRINFGLGFGAVKRCKIIKKLMEYYLCAHFLNFDGTINEIPSPVIQSKMLLEMGLENGTNLRNLQGLSVYPVDVLSPKNPYTGEMYITDNTYAIHHFDGTWLSNDMKNDRQIRLKNAKRILEMTESF